MSNSIRQQGVVNYWRTEASKNSREVDNLSREAHEAKMQKIEVEQKVEKANQDIQGYEAENEYLMHLGNKLADRLESTQQQLAKAQAEANFYKSLLSKPMAEIAEHNGDFKAAYEAQRELLAGWIVSQKAFKEVAIELGVNGGKSKEDVIEMANQAKVNVLNNETEHGNNASEVEFLNPYVEILRAKMKK